MENIRTRFMHAGKELLNWRCYVEVRTWNCQWIVSLFLGFARNLNFHGMKINQVNLPQRNSKFNCVRGSFIQHHGVSRAPHLFAPLLGDAQLRFLWYATVISNEITSTTVRPIFATTILSHAVPRPGLSTHRYEFPPPFFLPKIFV